MVGGQQQEVVEADLLPVTLPAVVVREPSVEVVESAAVVEVS
jgi:hypothetical protein